MNKYIFLILLCSSIAFGLGYSVNVTFSVDNRLDSYELSVQDYEEIASMESKIRELNPDASSINIDELPESSTSYSSSPTSKTLNKVNIKPTDSKTLLFTDAPISTNSVSSKIYSI